MSQNKNDMDEKTLELFLGFMTNISVAVQNFEKSLSNKQISEHIKICIELGEKFKFLVIPLTWYDDQKDLLVSLFKFRDSFITFETAKQPLVENKNSYTNAFCYWHDPESRKKGITKLDNLCSDINGPYFKQYIH